MAQAGSMVFAVRLEQQKVPPILQGEPPRLDPKPDARDLRRAMDQVGNNVNADIETYQNN